MPPTATPTLAPAAIVTTATLMPPTATPTPAPAATETTATFQQGANGYSGSEDTYIYQYGGAANYSTGAGLKVGYKQMNAVLLRFDLSAIPASASVTRATLQLYGSGWNGSEVVIGAYVITRAVRLAETTWSAARVGFPWRQAGCNSTVSDRRATAESVVTTSGINKWYSFDLTAAAQGWVTGTIPNNGVLLRAAMAVTSAFHFWSANSTAASTRPKLVITYRASSAPR